MRGQSSARLRIIAYLGSLDQDVSSQEIATALRLPLNTVRGTVNRLVAKGEAVRTTKGRFRVDVSRGGAVGIRPSLVQNLAVVGRHIPIRVEDWGLVRVWEMPDVGGGIFRVRVLLGGKRSKVSWTVRASRGLDLYGLRLAKWLVEEFLRCRHYPVPEWMCMRSEAFRDHFGAVGLQGAKMITLDAVDGVLLKLYEKSYGVRVETQINKPIGFDKLEALWMGGLPAYQLSQGVGYVSNNIEALAKRIDLLTQQLFNSNRVQQAMWEKMLKMIEEKEKKKQ